MVYFEIYFFKGSLIIDPSQNENVKSLTIVASARDYQTTSNPYQRFINQRVQSVVQYQNKLQPS